MALGKKKGAMELSVSTMIIVVLAMVLLVLGVFFIQRIFGSATNAIDSIDSQVQSEIQKLFADEAHILAVYPTSREVILKKGDRKGFAFSIRNSQNEARLFEYEIEAVESYDFSGKCGSSFSKAQADYWMVISSGSFNLAGAATSTLPELILFDIPEEAPSCSIPYRIDITANGEPYANTQIYLVIK
ncbi:hypothetical protein K0A97_02065 [Patescibacteria group bacterium]|nr:hypothetical protein [Patescibacteria group bacterium]